MTKGRVKFEKNNVLPLKQKVNSKASYIKMA